MHYAGRNPKIAVGKLDTQESWYIASLKSKGLRTTDANGVSSSPNASKLETQE